MYSCNSDQRGLPPGWRAPEPKPKPKPRNEVYYFSVVARPTKSARATDKPTYIRKALRRHHKNKPVEARSPSLPMIHASARGVNRCSRAEGKREAWKKSVELANVVSGKWSKGKVCHKSRKVSHGIRTTHHRETGGSHAAWIESVKDQVAFPKLQTGLRAAKASMGLAMNERRKETAISEGDALIKNFISDKVSKNAKARTPTPRRQAPTSGNGSFAADLARKQKIGEWSEHYARIVGLRAAILSHKTIWGGFTAEGKKIRDLTEAKVGMTLQDMNERIIKAENVLRGYNVSAREIPAKTFKLARTADDADIEINPGPASGHIGTSIGSDSDHQSTATGYCWLSIFDDVWHDYLRERHGPIIPASEIIQIARERGVADWDSYARTTSMINGVTVSHVVRSDDGYDLMTLLFEVLGADDLVGADRGVASRSKVSEAITGIRNQAICCECKQWARGIYELGAFYCRPCYDGGLEAEGIVPSDDEEDYQVESPGPSTGSDTASVPSIPPAKYSASGYLIDFDENICWTLPSPTNAVLRVAKDVIETRPPSITMVNDYEHDVSFFHWAELADTPEEKKERLKRDVFDMRPMHPREIQAMQVKDGLRSSEDFRVAKVCTRCDQYNPHVSWGYTTVSGISGAGESCVTTYADHTGVAKVCMSCQAAEVAQEDKARSEARESFMYWTKLAHEAKSEFYESEWDFPALNWLQDFTQSLFSRVPVTYDSDHWQTHVAGAKRAIQAYALYLRVGTRLAATESKKGMKLVRFWVKHAPLIRIVIKNMAKSLETPFVPFPSKSALHSAVARKRAYLDSLRGPVSTQDLADCMSRTFARLASGKKAEKKKAKKAKQKARIPSSEVSADTAKASVTPPTFYVDKTAPFDGTPGACWKILDPGNVASGPQTISFVLSLMKSVEVDSMARDEEIFENHNNLIRRRDALAIKRDRRATRKAAGGSRDVFGPADRATLAAEILLVEKRLADFVPPEGREIWMGPSEDGKCLHLAPLPWCRQAMPFSWERLLMWSGIYNWVNGDREPARRGNARQRANRSGAPPRADMRECSMSADVPAGTTQKVGRFKTYMKVGTFGIVQLGGGGSSCPGFHGSLKHSQVQRYVNDLVGLSVPIAGCVGCLYDRSYQQGRTTISPVSTSTPLVTTHDTDTDFRSYKVYDYVLPIWEDVKQASKVTVGSYVQKVFPESTRLKPCRRHVLWDRECHESTEVKGCSVEKYVPIVSKLTSNVTVLAPSATRELTATEVEAGAEYIEDMVLSARKAVDAFDQANEDRDDPEGENGLIALCRKIVALWDATTDKRAWVKPYTSRTIECTAMAAAGKSHAILENISAGSCIMVPTSKERLSKSSKTEGKGVLVATPQLWLVEVLSGSKWLDIAIDEAWLQHQGCQAIAKVCAYRNVIIMGDSDQIHAVNYSGMKWKFDGSKRKAIPYDMVVKMRRQYRSLPAIVALSNVMDPARAQKAMRTGEGPGVIDFGDDNTADFVTFALQATKDKYRTRPCATFHEYQGGEASHVLVDLDAPLGKPYGTSGLTNYIYVGLTRARDHLSIVGDHGLVHKVRALLTKSVSEPVAARCDLEWSWTAFSGKPTDVHQCGESEVALHQPVLLELPILPELPVMETGFSVDEPEDPATVSNTASVPTAYETVGLGLPVDKCTSPQWYPGWQDPLMGTIDDPKDELLIFKEALPRWYRNLKGPKPAGFDVRKSRLPAREAAELEHANVKSPRRAKLVSSPSAYTDGYCYAKAIQYQYRKKAIRALGKEPLAYDFYNWVAEQECSLFGYKVVNKVDASSGSDSDRRKAATAVVHLSNKRTSLKAMSAAIKDTNMIGSSTHQHLYMCENDWEVRVHPDQTIHQWSPRQGRWSNGRVLIDGRPVPASEALLVNHKLVAFRKAPSSLDDLMTVQMPALTEASRSHDQLASHDACVRYIQQNQPSEEVIEVGVSRTRSESDWDKWHAAPYGFTFNRTLGGIFTSMTLRTPEGSHRITFASLMSERGGRSAAIRSIGEYWGARHPLAECVHAHCDYSGPEHPCWETAHDRAIERNLVHHDEVMGYLTEGIRDHRGIDLPVLHRNIHCLDRIQDGDFEIPHPQPLDLPAEDRYDPRDTDSVPQPPHIVPLSELAEVHSSLVEYEEINEIIDFQGPGLTMTVAEIIEGLDLPPVPFHEFRMHTTPEVFARLAVSGRISARAFRRLQEFVDSICEWRYHEEMIEGLFDGVIDVPANTVYYTTYTSRTVVRQDGLKPQVVESVETEIRLRPRGYIMPSVFQATGAFPTSARIYIQGEGHSRPLTLVRRRPTDYVVEWTETRVARISDDIVNTSSERWYGCYNPDRGRYKILASKWEDFSALVVPLEDAAASARLPFAFILRRKGSLIRPVEIKTRDARFHMQRPSPAYVATWDVLESTFIRSLQLGVTRAKVVKDYHAAKRTHFKDADTCKALCQHTVAEMAGMNSKDWFATLRQAVTQAFSTGVGNFGNVGSLSTGQIVELLETIARCLQGTVALPQFIRPISALLDAISDNVNTPSRLTLIAGGLGVDLLAQLVTLRAEALITPAFVSDNASKLADAIASSDGALLQSLITEGVVRHITDNIPSLSPAVKRLFYAGFAHAGQHTGQLKLQEIAAVAANAVEAGSAKTASGLLVTRADMIAIVTAGASGALVHPVPALFKATEGLVAAMAKIYTHPTDIARLTSAIGRHLLAKVVADATSHDTDSVLTKPFVDANAAHIWLKLTEAPPDQLLRLVNADFIAFLAGNQGRLSSGTVHALQKWFGTSPAAIIACPDPAAHSQPACPDPSAHASPVVKLPETLSSAGDKYWKLIESVDDVKIAKELTRRIKAAHGISADWILEQLGKAGPAVYCRSNHDHAARVKATLLRELATIHGEPVEAMPLFLLSQDQSLTAAENNAAMAYFIQTAQVPPDVVLSLVKHQCPGGVQHDPVSCGAHYVNNARSDVDKLMDELGFDIAKYHPHATHAANVNEPDALKRKITGCATAHANYAAAVSSAQKAVEMAEAKATVARTAAFTVSKVAFQYPQWWAAMWSAGVVTINAQQFHLPKRTKSIKYRGSASDPRIDNLVTKQLQGRERTEGLLTPAGVALFYHSQNAAHKREFARQLGMTQSQLVSVLPSDHANKVHVIHCASYDQVLLSYANEKHVADGGYCWKSLFDTSDDCDVLSLLFGPAPSVSMVQAAATFVRLTKSVRATFTPGAPVHISAGSTPTRQVVNALSPPATLKMGGPTGGCWKALFNHFRNNPRVAAMIPDKPMRLTDLRHSLIRHVRVNTPGFDPLRPMWVERLANGLFHTEGWVDPSPSLGPVNGETLTVSDLIRLTNDELATRFPIPEMTVTVTDDAWGTLPFFGYTQDTIDMGVPAEEEDSLQDGGSRGWMWPSGLYLVRVEGRVLRHFDGHEIVDHDLASPMRALTLVNMLSGWLMSTRRRYDSPDWSISGSWPKLTLTHRSTRPAENLEWHTLATAFSYIVHELSKVETPLQDQTLRMGATIIERARRIVPFQDLFNTYKQVASEAAESRRPDIIFLEPAVLTEEHESWLEKTAPRYTRIDPPRHFRYGCCELDEARRERNEYVIVGESLSGSEWIAVRTKIEGPSAEGTLWAVVSWIAKEHGTTDMPVFDRRYGAAHPACASLNSHLHGHFVDFDGSTQMWGHIPVYANHKVVFPKEWFAKHRAAPDRTALNHAGLSQMLECVRCGYQAMSCTPKLKCYVCDALENMIMPANETLPTVASVNDVVHTHQAPLGSPRHAPGPGKTVKVGHFTFSSEPSRMYPFGRKKNGRSTYGGTCQPLLMPRQHCIWIDAESAHISMQFATLNKYPRGTRFEVMTIWRAPTAGMVPLVLTPEAGPYPSAAEVIRLPPSFHGKMPMAKARLLPLVHGNREHIFWVTNSRADHLYEGSDLSDRVSDAFPIWSQSDNMQPQMESIWARGSSINWSLFWRYYGANYDVYGGDEALLFCTGVAFVPLAGKPRKYWVNITPSTDMTVDFKWALPYRAEHGPGLKVAQIDRWDKGYPFFIQDLKYQLPSFVGTGEPLSVHIVESSLPDNPSAQPDIGRQHLGHLEHDTVGQIKCARGPSRSYQYGRHRLAKTPYFTELAPYGEGVMSSSEEAELLRIVTVERALTAGLAPNVVVNWSTWYNGGSHPSHFTIVLRRPDEPLIPNVHNIVVPRWFSSKIAMAKLRLLPMFFGRRDLVYQTGNHRAGECFWPSQSPAHRVSESEPVISSTWRAAPVVDFCAFRGSCSRTDYRRLFGDGLEVYGLDEGTMWSAGTVVVGTTEPRRYWNSHSTSGIQECYWAIEGFNNGEFFRQFGPKEMCIVGGLTSCHVTTGAFALDRYTRTGKMEDFLTLATEGLATPIPAAKLWLRQPTRMILGLPGYGLSEAYRGDEVSCLRQPQHKGLHWLSVPALPTIPLAPWIEEVVATIERAARVREGKVVITANPDGPPPPPSLGFAAIAFGKGPPGWLYVDTPPMHGRQMAFIRLVVMLTGPEVCDWWVVNGRDVEQQVLPDFNQGRLTTFNRFDLTPLVLYSTRSDLKWTPDMPCFMALFHLAFAYGIDEWALKHLPMTAQCVVEPSASACWFFPEEGEWPDVQIFCPSGLWFSGALSRLSAHAKLLGPGKKTITSDAASVLRGITRRNFDHVESRLSPAPLLTDVLGDVPNKSEAILVVAYGTRGDVVPVSYMASVIQAMNIPVYLYILENVSSAALRDIVAGNVWPQIPVVLRMLAFGNLGFKAVLTPQFRVPGNAASFELTPWEYVAPIRTIHPVADFLMNSFIALKNPDIKIGAIIGSNFPRSANGSKALRYRPQTHRAPKIGWVAGSDGVDAVPRHIREGYPQIVDPDHAGAAFTSYTAVWCTGGQGIMQTLRMHDVEPLVYAPGLDRSLLLPMSPGALVEPDFGHLTAVLYRLGFVLTGDAKLSYKTTIRLYVDRLRQVDLYHLVRMAVILYNLHGYVMHVASAVATFPELVGLVKTPLLRVPVYGAAVIFRYPALVSTLGFVNTIWLLACMQIAVQYAKCKLAATHGTYLVVQTNRKWPFIEHMMIVDKIRGERVHMQWQGDRRNLVNPFRGVVDTNTGTHPGQVWIPVAINFPAVVRKMKLSANRYSPWFNCQVNMPAYTDYEFTVCVIVILAQLTIFPFTAGAYIMFLILRNTSWKFCGLPPESFYRFGTADEYERLTKDLEAEEAAVRKWQEDLDALMGTQNAPDPTRPLDPPLPDIISVQVGESTDLPLVTAKLNPDARKDTESVLAKFKGQMAADPQSATLDDLILWAAVMAEEAKQHGFDEAQVYHCAILALHDTILEIPEPPEVDIWRTRFIPRTVSTADELVQRLSLFIKGHLHELPTIGKTLISKLYLWIDALASRLKGVAIKAFAVIATIGDYLAEFSIDLWLAFSDWAAEAIEYLFGGKLAKRIKAAWALGGVAKNPAMAKQRRLQEMYAMAHYERKGYFEDEYIAALDNIKSNLPSFDTMLKDRTYPNHKFGRRIMEWADENQDMLMRHEDVREASAKVAEKEAAVSALQKQAHSCRKSDPSLYNRLVGQIPRAQKEASHAHQVFTETKMAYWPKTLVAPSVIRDREVGFGGTQYRQTKVPSRPVMSRQEAQAIFGEEWESAVWEDTALSEQVAIYLSRGATQTMDHMWETAARKGKDGEQSRIADVMWRMQERYAWYGLEFNPTEEPIPPAITDQEMALYDQLARIRVAHHPEKYANRKITSPEALINYLEWPRASGPMFEGRPTTVDRHRSAMSDVAKRYRAWESGLGYAVLKKAYRDAQEGRVDIQQFSAFVKSQPTPVDKLARGVTFMPITQWFKGMMEAFAQNQRVHWETTRVGKNMPLNQNMRPFFEEVMAMPIKFEADARQMDSRFQELQLYGVGRIAYHAWVNWSNSTNGAAIASHKSERYKALADGWIFNLHVEPGQKAPRWMRTMMHHPNAKAYSNVTAKRRGGATGLEDTTDLNSDAFDLMFAATLVEYGQRIGRPIHPSDAMDEAKALLVHTSDDNITGLDLWALYGITEEEFDTELFVDCARAHQLDLTIIWHQKDNGRYLEYLSHFCRPITVQDKRTLDRVNAIYRARGIMREDEEIVDPRSGVAPHMVVYQNTTAMDSRRTANNAFKQHKFRDRYLLSIIQKDVGQAQLKAHLPKAYLQNATTYSYNAIRYLAAAAFPDTCRDANGLPRYPSDDAELTFIKAHLHVKYEDVVCRMPTIHIDGQVLANRFPYKDRRHKIPAEFAARLKELKLSPMPKYSDIVYNHYKKSSKPKDWADRILGKINKGVLARDEPYKEIVEICRLKVESIPRKWSKGMIGALQMIHPDDLHDGSGLVEAAIYLAEEIECAAAGVPVTSGGFNRRINQSPYAGCCNPSAKFYEYNTKEGREKLHQHPLYVYTNMCWLISINYGFMWFVERWIMSLPWIGLGWAMLMFYLIDIAKLYAILNLLYWHHHMKVSYVVSGLLPRDVYIHSKRFVDWYVGLMPIQLGYILRFDIASAWIAGACEYIAQFVQHGTHVMPQAMTQAEAIDNPWKVVAEQAMDELEAAPPAQRIVSVKGPTGTGKSTFFAYEMFRQNLIEKGGVTYIVAPFTVLRDDWGLPSWFHVHNADEAKLPAGATLFQVLKGGVSRNPNARIFLCTYGHFVNRVKANEISPQDVCLFDETHIGTASQILATKILLKNNCRIVNLSATPAPLKKVPTGRLIDATPVVPQHHSRKVVEFPDSTNAVAMYQQMRKATDKDPLLGYSHAELSQRCIVKVNTIPNIEKFTAAMEELRKADPGIPRVWEFSSAAFKSQKAERDAWIAQHGTYILAATDLIEVGYDVKPAAWSLIDTGKTIKQHQGYLLPPTDSTATQREQFHGRVGRNSSDRDGLIYCTGNAGTGAPAQAYDSGSYFIYPEVCESFEFPILLPLPHKAVKEKLFGMDFTQFYEIRADIEYSESIRLGLHWACLAAFSGVEPRDLPSFYHRYGERGFSMPEEYEWMTSQLARIKSSMARIPSWKALEMVLHQEPFMYHVAGNAIEGRSQGPEPHLSYASLIYPKAGKWVSYPQLLKHKREIRTTAKITTEGEAFDEMVAHFEKEISSLKLRLEKARNAKRQPGAPPPSMLKDELLIRNASANLAAVKAVKEASNQIDAQKPAIAKAIGKEAKARAMINIAASRRMIAGALPPDMAAAVRTALSPPPGRIKPRGPRDPVHSVWHEKLQKHLRDNKLEKFGEKFYDNIEDFTDDPYAFGPEGLKHLHDRQEEMDRRLLKGHEWLLGRKDDGTFVLMWFKSRKKT